MSRIGKLISSINEAATPISFNGKRLFHVTSNRQASSILKYGYDVSHKAMGGKWATGRFSPSRNGTEDMYMQYFAQYHLLLPLIPKKEWGDIEDKMGSIGASDGDEAEAGKIFYEFWNSKVKSGWVVMWVGVDSVFPDYGSHVLEFFPKHGDILMNDLYDIHAVASLKPKFTRDQFKLVGVIDPEWKKRMNVDDYDAIPIEGVKFVSEEEPDKALAM